MKNMIRKAVVATSIGAMVIAGAAGAVGAAAPTYDDVVEGQTRMCMDLRKEAQALVDEYESAGTERREMILGRLENLGKKWNERGCRSRFGDVTLIPVLPIEPGVGEVPEPGAVDPGTDTGNPVGPGDGIDWGIATHGDTELATGDGPGTHPSTTGVDLAPPVVTKAPAKSTYDPDGKGDWGCTTRANGQVDCYKNGETCTKQPGGTSWVCDYPHAFDTPPPPSLTRIAGSVAVPSGMLRLR